MQKTKALFVHAFTIEKAIRGFLVGAICALIAVFLCPWWVVIPIFAIGAGLGWLEACSRENAPDNRRWFWIPSIIERDPNYRYFQIVRRAHKGSTLAELEREWGFPVKIRGRSFRLVWPSEQLFVGVHIADHNMRGVMLFNLFDGAEQDNVENIGDFVLRPHLEEVRDYLKAISQGE